MFRIIVSFLLFTSIYSYSQTEANIWYFGQYAGLDFNSNPPVALTDGELTTGEGCASISDANGNLLFYTDGTEVWDKTHAKMKHGAGLFGHSSSTQSAIIVPNPSDGNIFYIFTVDESGHSNGLCYSAVDMSLNSGLGEVLENEKNVPLISPVSEKITAIKSASNGSFYVFTYRNGTFYNFEVSNLGVDTTPIQTNSGFYIENSEGRGYLKASPRGDKIAIAHEYNKKVFIYDLDLNTGVVSNEKELFLDDPSHPSNDTDTFPYGVEFSPNSDLLYITSATEDYSPNFDENKSYLWQFDLLAASPEHSSTLIDYQEGMYRGALQLAPDYKVYHALSRSYGTGYNKMGVIEQPNAVGTACNYSYASVDLAGRNSRQGLPPFIQSIFNTEIEVDDVCVLYPAAFSLVDTTDIISITWDFGDGSPPVSGTYTPTHQYDAAGVYLVKATVTTNIGTQIFTEWVQVYPEPIADILDDVISCDSYMLKQLVAGNYYTGSLGTGTQLFPNDIVVSSQTIYIYAETETNPNCFDESSFDIVITPSPIAVTLDDITAKNVYVLPGISEGDFYTESNGQGTLLFAGDEITSSQRIYIYVTIGIPPNVCSGESSFLVTIEQDIEYMNFFTPNGNGENDYWNVFNPESLNLSEINIFNRFGKLVAIIDPNGLGWDGTYRGEALPSTEYWFTVTLEDGTIKKGNFSLIRM